MTCLFFLSRLRCIILNLKGREEVELELRGRRREREREGPNKRAGRVGVRGRRREREREGPKRQAWWLKRQWRFWYHRGGRFKWRWLRRCAWSPPIGFSFLKPEISALTDRSLLRVLQLVLLMIKTRSKKFYFFTFFFLFTFNLFDAAEFWYKWWEYLKF